MLAPSHRMKSPSVPFVPLEWPRRLLVAGFIVASVWYLGWRIGTFNPHAPMFSALVYGAELFGFVTALLHLFMCWRLTRAQRAAAARWACSVDVFVPTYNESVEMVRRRCSRRRRWTIRTRPGCSTTATAPRCRRWRAQLGCRYLARRRQRTRQGRQPEQCAGTQPAASWSRSSTPTMHRGATSSQDAGLLRRPGGWLRADAAGLLQPRLLPAPLARRGRARSGPSSRCSSASSSAARTTGTRPSSAAAARSCGAARSTQIGGFATGTVTEDLHTSHPPACARAIKSVYHAESLAFGLAPESIEPFIEQRVRWGQGAMHVWRKEGILVRRGLTLAQRLNYLASVLTYFDGWQKAIFYFAPVIVLLTGAHAVADHDAGFPAALSCPTTCSRSGCSRKSAAATGAACHRAVQHGALRRVRLGDAGLGVAEDEVPRDAQGCAVARGGSLHGAAMGGDDAELHRHPGGTRAAVAVVRVRCRSTAWSPTRSGRWSTARWRWP